MVDGATHLKKIDSKLLLHPSLQQSRLQSHSSPDFQSRSSPDFGLVAVLVHGLVAVLIHGLVAAANSQKKMNILYKLSPRFEPTTFLIHDLIRKNMTN